MAMPLASAMPIAIANWRLSRLPWSTTTGCWVRWSSTTPTTSASWGPVAFGAGAGPGSFAPVPVRSTTTRSPKSAIDRLLPIPTPPVPPSDAAWKVWVPPRGKSTCAEAKTRRKSGREEQGKAAPHDPVAPAVDDVAEDERAQRAPREEDRAEDSDDASAARLRRLVHQQGGEGRIEQAVGASCQEAGEEEEREHGDRGAGSDQEGQRRQDAGGGGLDEHGRDDDRPASQRIAEPTSQGANEHRRPRVGRVEEGQVGHAEELPEGRQEGEDRPGAEAEKERQRHVQAQDLGQALPDDLRSARMPRHGPGGLADPERQGQRRQGQERCHREERAEAEAADHELAGQRREGRGKET